MISFNILIRNSEKIVKKTMKETKDDRLLHGRPLMHILKRLSDEFVTLRGIHT